MELTIAFWRRWGAAYLEQEAASVLAGDSPLETADALLRNLISAERENYRDHFEKELSAAEINRYKEWLTRYKIGEPLPYITGEADFFGLRLAVGPGVLIPRPDTETLVLAGLSVLQKIACQQATAQSSSLKAAGSEASPFLALEPCAGSLAVSLALDLLYAEWRAEAGPVGRFPALQIVAGDLSAKALFYAKINLRRHQRADTRICLQQADLFFTNPNHRGADATPAVSKGIGEAGLNGCLAPASAWLIIANPPYIERSTLADLDPSVTAHEPLLALDGGADGLHFYRRLAREAKDVLRPGGFIVVEHGYNQGEAVASVFRDAGDWVQAETLPDLAGRDRVYRACLQPAQGVSGAL